ncbi:MAG: DUF2127 domain-containing protein [Candidatus Sulfotelmatobacter sp.]|jgi:uncharacterized membrane protein (DUF2068 family)
MALSVRKIGLPSTQRRLLRLVAFFEFLKGAFVLVVGFTAILLVHKDAWVLAESLLALLHVSTDRHSAQLFLDFADDITPARLWAAAFLSFTYSILRFIEAYGLWKQRTWAEWVAFGSGALLIPWEIREMARGITLLRSVLLVGNLIIVAYMLFLLRSGRLRAENFALQAEPGGGSTPTPMPSTDSPRNPD